MNIYNLYFYKLVDCANLIIISVITHAAEKRCFYYIIITCLLQYSKIVFFKYIITFKVYLIETCSDFSK